MRSIVIIQARIGSSRLPGKVLKPILGKPMLWHIISRIRHVRDVAEIIVATSDLSVDEPIRLLCEEFSTAYFLGSETDVLDRFYKAAVKYKGDPIIRITGDCPFVDPEIISKLINMYKTGCYDHVGVATGAGAIFLEGGRYPDGMDAECFSLSALEKAWKEATDHQDREHVTPYIWRNKQIFRCGVLLSPEDYSHLRWTVDHDADFQLVSAIYNALYKENSPFLMSDILNYLVCHSELATVNHEHIGKEEYLELWKQHLIKKEVVD